MPSWKPEVITEPDGKWSSNALRFATKDEALGYAQDLYARWTLVRQWRAVECDDPVTSTWDIARPASTPRPRAPDSQGLMVEVIKPEDIGKLLDDLMRKPPGTTAELMRRVMPGEPEEL